MATVIEELERIRNANDGLLRPADVVEAARPRASPLHEKFTWDDSAAAHAYRLWQARELIQVTVRVLPGSTESVRAYVSLSDDRSEEGGGYRCIVSVLSNKATREQMLAEALAELERIERTYKNLSELAAVFAAARKARAKAA